jgi:hypothetical protein
MSSSPVNGEQRPAVTPSSEAPASPRGERKQPPQATDTLAGAGAPPDARGAEAPADAGNAGWYSYIPQCAIDLFNTVYAWISGCITSCLSCFSSPTIPSIPLEGHERTPAEHHTENGEQIRAAFTSMIETWNRVTTQVDADFQRKVIVFFERTEQNVASGERFTEIKKENEFIFNKDNHQTFQSQLAPLIGKCFASETGRNLVDFTMAVVILSPDTIKDEEASQKGGEDVMKPTVSAKVRTYAYNNHSTNHQPHCERTGYDSFAEYKATMERLAAPSAPEDIGEEVETPPAPFLKDKLQESDFRF